MSCSHGGAWETGEKGGGGRRKEERDDGSKEALLSVSRQRELSPPPSPLPHGNLPKQLVTTPQPGRERERERERESIDKTHHHQLIFIP